MKFEACQSVNTLMNQHSSTPDIFVTTLTSVGCVKKIAKCKFFQFERKKTALQMVLSRICVYACEYAYTGAIFFVTFPNFQYGRGYKTFDSIKCHRFHRKNKSWSNLPNFHKGGPLRTSEAPRKDAFSDQQLEWFQASESCKSFCLVSILVRSEAATKI